MIPYKSVLIVSMAVVVFLTAWSFAKLSQKRGGVDGE